MGPSLRIRLRVRGPALGGAVVAVEMKGRFHGVESPKRSFLVSWTMSDHSFFLVMRAILMSRVETLGSFLISNDQISEYVSCFSRWSSTSTSGRMFFLLQDVSMEYNFKKLVFKLFCLILLFGKSRSLGAAASLSPKTKWWRATVPVPPGRSRISCFLWWTCPCPCPSFSRRRSFC